MDFSAVTLSKRSGKEEVAGGYYNCVSPQPSGVSRTAGTGNEKCPDNGIGFVLGWGKGEKKFSSLAVDSSSRDRWILLGCPCARAELLAHLGKQPSDAAVLGGGTSEGRGPISAEVEQCFAVDFRRLLTQQSPTQDQGPRCFLSVGGNLQSLIKMPKQATPGIRPGLPDAHTSSSFYYCQSLLPHWKYP